MAGSSKGIRAGGAYIELSLFDSKFKQGLSAVETKLKRLGSSIRGIGMDMMGFGAAITAPLALAAKQYADFGSTIYDLSKRTGFSTEALSTLGYAAEQSGSNIQGLEAAVRRMHKVINDAATGTKGAQETLSALGLSVASLSSVAPEVRFDKILEALSGIDDEGTRAALAMDIFGKSGTQLLPMLDGGYQAFERLRQELRAMGGELSALDAKQADELGDSIGRLGRSFKILRNEIGQALAPTLMRINSIMMDIVGGVSDFINNNRELVVGLAAVGAAMTALGASAVTLSAALSGVATTLSLVGSALTPMGFVGISFATLIASTVDWKLAVESVAESLRSLPDALTAGDWVSIGRMIGLALRIGIESSFGNVFDWMADRLENFNLTGGKVETEMSAALREAAKGQEGEIRVLQEQLRGLRNRVRLEAQQVRRQREERAREEKAAADAGEAVRQKQGQQQQQTLSWFTSGAFKIGEYIAKVSQGGASALTGAMSRLNDMAQTHVEAVRAAQQVWEETRTPVERYEASLERVKDLFAKKVIDEDTFNRSVAKLKEELNTALLADLPIGGLNIGAMFGGNRAAEVYAAETFQRQAVALAKEQLGQLKEINRNLKQGQNVLAFQ